ncbi:MAGa4850 family ICE element protein [Mycoplasma putrefaciens]|uniref:Uncharacterized protein n=1 Tax=Mycoplasma putrefaciens Mput9231 TaxID=1292033 RepID=M9WGR3_9MOLU|nr:hypothetical protein [Mycoplasma putrefaciens]AGJ90645.1 hypothetical protein MPUT9231_2140 [Mycoplasma putrefaciens Mput9231]
MGAFKNLLLKQQEGCSKNELQFEKITSNFNSLYEAKRYDRLPSKTIAIISKQTKLVISESYLAKLRGEKVATEIILFLKATKRFDVTKNTLLEYGFKKSSIKLAIKKLISFSIIDEHIYKTTGILKLRKANLKNKNEKFWIVKGELIVKFFLLCGLTVCLAMLDSLYCLSKTKDRLVKNTNRKYALVQNSYFAKLNAHRTTIWNAFKALANFLGIMHSKLILIQRTCKKKIEIIKNQKGRLIRKIIGYEFSTERLLSSEIKRLILKVD